MTVAEMMSKMSAKEFQYWMIYTKTKQDLEKRAAAKAK